MEMVLKIKNVFIENIDLSNTLVEPGTLLRINFSDLEMYNKYFYNKNLLSFNQKVIHLYYWGKKVSKKNIFCTYSPNKLFKKHLNFDCQEINEFEELIYPTYKEKELISPLNERMKSLPFGDKMLIYCKLFIEKNKSPFIFGTAGMHVHNLKVTYQLISSFLSKGGCCIEMTYPPIDKNEFKDILEITPKIIDIKNPRKK